MSESRPEKRKVEFIESYWTGGEFGSDYQWNDNYGELIRCKDCEYKEWVGDSENIIYCPKMKLRTSIDWFCADGRKKDD